MEPLAVLPALSAALTTAKILREMAGSGEASMEDIVASITELHADLNVLAGAVADGRQREAELTDEVHRLKAELFGLRDWGKVLSEYRLESVGQSVLAYVHQATKSDPSAAHWLCQPCADAGHKRVLQCTNRAVSCTFTCPRCDYSISVSEEAAKRLGAEPYVPSM